MKTFRQKLKQTQHLTKLLISVFIYFGCYNWAFAKDNLVFLGDPWCPFTCEPGTSAPGIISEVATKVFAKAKLNIEYQSMNWSRAIVETREGKFAGLLGALKTDAPDFIFPKHSIVNQESCFYKMKSDPWIYSENTLTKLKTLGAVRDYTYGEPFDTILKEKKEFFEKVDFVSGEETSRKLIQKLLAGRIQVLIEDKSVIKFRLSTDKTFNDSDRSKIVEAGCLKPTPLFIAFSPKNPDSKKFADIFDNEFPAFSRSPEFKKILLKYQ